MSRQQYRSLQSSLRRAWAHPATIDRPAETDGWEILRAALACGLTSGRLPPMTFAERREYDEDRLRGLRAPPLTRDFVATALRRARPVRPSLP